MIEAHRILTMPQPKDPVSVFSVVDQILAVLAFHP